MRELFENGTIKYATMNGYKIRLLPNGCFEVRQEKTNWLVFESDSKATFEWVRDYVFQLKPLD